jgi:hypothetical protein
MRARYRARPYPSRVPNRRPKLELVTPAPSPEEAAAVIAAVERFLRDYTPVLVAPAPKRNAWQRAAILEATGREPEAPSPRGDPIPWG